MRGQARTTLLALISLVLIAVTLVACNASAGGGGSDNGNIAGFKTPNPLLFTPTPTFPPFTIGVWPSNFSPGANDTVNFYVICRIQPADMKGPATPAPGLTVTVDVVDLGKSNSATTDSDGLAVVPISYTNAQSGQPLQARARVTYQGHTYLAITVFTPDVSTAPTVTPGGPTATP
jgi:predicted small secreted protein